MTCDLVLDHMSQSVNIKITYEQMNKQIYRTSNMHFFNRKLYLETKISHNEAKTLLNLSNLRKFRQKKCFSYNIDYINGITILLSASR